MRPKNGETTFEGYMDTLYIYLERLGKHSQAEMLNAALRFIDKINITKGVPQPNAPWDDDANVRGPYQSTIPGMISEVASAKCVAPRGSGKEVRNAYSQKEQVDDKIDFWVDGDSYQSKTVCFKGSSVWIEKEYVEGIADYVTLVDIDDRRCIVVPRTVLKQYVEMRIDLWQFERMGAQIFEECFD